MNNTQLLSAVEKFIGRFTEKGWESLEMSVPYPLGLSLIELGIAIKQEDLAKMKMVKFFSPDENDAACLSWTAFDSHNGEELCFMQLNFGNSQLQTDNYEILINTIEQI